MSRRLARENTFKLVFEYLFSDEENDITLQSAIDGTDEKERAYVRSVYKAIIDNRDEIKALIQTYSRDFAYDRIYKVDLAVLYVAISEILYLGIPFQVSANEAVELCKKYSTDKSPAFINGILAAIIAQIAKK